LPLTHFHPAVRRWFSETLGEPTAAQRHGWAAIRERRHTLIAAPTGSGKTLAAFLTALDDLIQEGLRAPLPDEVRVLYVSPLKALSADVHKNLAEPRKGIRRVAAEMGLDAPRITAAVRTGDTTPGERAAMLRKPPHILVTTPESLYLLLTAERGRQMLRTVRTVIVDEIHAVIGTRRGSHLALSLERLQHLAESPLLRLGLSATQTPIEEVAQYLAPNAECTIVDEGHRRAMDVGLELPRSALSTVMSHEVWGEYYDRLQELIGQHRTTLVFVNTRRMAERVARHLSDRLGDDAVTAHHGSLSKDKRLDAESRLKSGNLKALVATASLELGIDIGSVDLVCQIGSPHRIATFLQRVGRSGHSVAGTPKGRLFPVSLDDLIECTALLRSVRKGELDRIVQHEKPLDVLAQQIVAEASCGEWSEDALFALVRGAWPYRALERREFDDVVKMTSEGFATQRGRRAALLHRDEVNGNLRGRRGSRMLAITSGGAIPEVADYRVVLDPEEIFIGTINEDFAIESTAGDIFQLGNSSWQILQVGSGVVRVADAKGAPPTLPFWLGEAPARSDELSRAVSDLRKEVAEMLCRTGNPACPDEADRQDCLSYIAEAGIPEFAAQEIVNYLAESLCALGVMPSQQTLVLERFFDESGGMQLILHAPFGSRINRAWGLALRKRFCRQFDFELQAAATEDALLLSLGPQHSFPLSDVFRYLHPATARDVLVQAFLDAPVWQTRWRWNATISLAIPRNRGGKKVPPPLQRAMADDLMAAVFPDAAACFENVAGDRQLPDHPLVNQAVRDCLYEAMDFDGLAAVLTRIHAGEIRCEARDTPEPSPLAHEILNAKPYAFLDDAPLEERRTQAVRTRRASGNDIGSLDIAAVERVRDEERPDPRDADELHDALLTAGFLTAEEAASIPYELFAELIGKRRAGRVRSLWVAAERLPEVLAVVPASVDFAAPPSRAARAWTREEALVELIRGRMTIVGPTTSSTLASELTSDKNRGERASRPLEAPVESEISTALITLESEGAVLRGSFTGTRELEWCDRRLLARIHRYTLNRLRSEIEPVSPATFMRFLFAWQHVAPAARLSGIDGLQSVIAMLDGYEIAAGAWERMILPARMATYEPSVLDMLCLTGAVGWARLSPATTGAVASTPIALFLRENAAAWLTLRTDGEIALSEVAQRILDALRLRGASFARDLGSACELNEIDLRAGIGELVSAGLIASDGFAGLRALIGARNARPDHAGRWSLLQDDDGDPLRYPERSRGSWAGGGAQRASSPAGPSTTLGMTDALETQARALLRRYGVVFRRLLTREANAAPWRELARVYRRLEARGEIRGGRFVSGMSGEQFALAEAVERLREVRREGADGRVIVISAADPLNLTGIVTSGEKIRAVAGNRIACRDGVPVSVMEGDYLRPLAELEPNIASEAAAALAGRKVPVAAGYVGRA
jgi:ATP-dependent Lhr-like helicase